MYQQRVRVFDHDIKHEKASSERLIDFEYFHIMGKNILLQGFNATSETR